MEVEKHMLDWLFIILLVIAILLVLLVVFEDFGIYWDMIFILVSIIIFFTLSASIMDIETPYSLYNATSGNIETGYHTVQSDISPYLSYLFMFFGAVMVIYLVMYFLGPAIAKRWMR
jgi:hypothetical protein